MSSSIYKSTAGALGSYGALTLLAPSAAATPVQPLGLSLGLTTGILAFAGSLSKNVIAKYTTNMIGLEGGAATQLMAVGVAPAAYLATFGGMGIVPSVTTGAVSYGGALVGEGIYTRFIDPFVAGGYIPSVVNV